MQLQRVVFRIRSGWGTLRESAGSSKCCIFITWITNWWYLCRVSPGGLLLSLTNYGVQIVCKSRNITFTAWYQSVCLCFTASSPRCRLQRYWILRLTVSQHLFTPLFTHHLQPALTHTCGEDVLTFLWLWGWRCFLSLLCEKRPAEWESGGGRAPVGYRSRDLSAPSQRTKPVVVKPLRWRKDDEQLSENPCGKEGQKKSKNPWRGLNKRKVLFFQGSQ